MKYSKKAVILAEKNGVLPRLRKQMIVQEVRKRYDADDELAILRQATTKPTEYNEYYSYAESCKATVDVYISECLK